MTSTLKTVLRTLYPYSHTWHDRDVDQNVDTIQVEMSSGSMVMWAGAMWHAGGANLRS